MPVGAAVGGGLGALGSLGSAALGYFGSQKAAQTQANYGQQALGTLQSMFGTAQNAVQPFVSAGQSVLPTLQKLLTPGADQTATLSQLPGFQFQSQWGNLATSNALAARGLGGSTGPLAKAISDYNQGLAGTSFGNLTGMLQNFAGMGSSAASSLGGLASNFGNSMAGVTQGIGSSLASGILGGTNALSTGLQGATNAGGNAFLLSSLLSKLGIGGASSGTGTSLYGSGTAAPSYTGG